MTTQFQIEIDNLSTTTDRLWMKKNLVMCPQAYMEEFYYLSLT